MKSEALKIHAEFQKLMEEHTKALEALLLRGQSVKPRLKLRKLPLWGEQVKLDQINFEWPTQEILDQLPTTCQLTSMTFKTANGYTRVGSIQCMLSTGQSSPVFEKEGISYQGPQTVIFNNAERPVRSVYGRDRDGNKNFIARIDFMDKNGSQIVQVFSYGTRKGEGNEHIIADNESLIGFYGVKDKENWFTSFGFIVKISLNNN